MTMKKIFQKLTIVLFILFANMNNSMSQCFNADFSNGDFTNWVGSTAENSGGNYSNIVNGVIAGTINSMPNNTGQQTIINNTALMDPNTGGLLRMTPPNGAPSCRLGNDLCYGCISSE